MGARPLCGALSPCPGKGRNPVEQLSKQTCTTDIGRMIGHPCPIMVMQTSDRWRGSATGRALDFAISRSRVHILLEATLRNNLGQVV